MGTQDRLPAAGTRGSPPGRRLLLCAGWRAGPAGSSGTHRSDPWVSLAQSCPEMVPASKGRAREAGTSAGKCQQQEHWCSRSQALLVPVHSGAPVPHLHGPPVLSSDSRQPCRTDGRELREGKPRQHRLSIFTSAGGSLDLVMGPVPPARPPPGAARPGVRVCCHSAVARGAVPSAVRQSWPNLAGPSPLLAQPAPRTWASFESYGGRGVGCGALEPLCHL